MPSDDRDAFICSPRQGENESRGCSLSFLERRKWRPQTRLQFSGCHALFAHPPLLHPVSELFNLDAGRKMSLATSCDQRKQTESCTHRVCTPALILDCLCTAVKLIISCSVEPKTSKMNCLVKLVIITQSLSIQTLQTSGLNGGMLAKETICW